MVSFRFIVLACRSGRHRSVAAAHLVSHALKKAGVNTECVHLCRHCWSKSCERGECERCSHSSRRDKATAASAYRVADELLAEVMSG